MDKRGAKILISCILCTVIVLVLFIVALRFSRMSCELISIDPQHLRQAQLDVFSGKKHKPIRSHDKMILMKMSAYLEYNIMSDKSGSASEQTGTNNNNNSTSTSNSNGNSFPVAGSTSSGNNQMQPQQQQLAGGTLANQQHPLAPISTSASNANNNNNPSVPISGSQQQQQQQRVSERFLPLDLESIETRSLTPSSQANNLVNKQKYILSFNCTKLNMVFVYQGSRVYVESMSLELSPASRQKTTCELQLPSSGAFAVDSFSSGPSNSDLQHSNFAHYSCNKTLSYNCYHYSTKSGPSPTQGMLLAELHINAFEFETYTGSSGNSGDSGNNKHKNKHNNKHHSHEHKHVEKEFKSKPSEYEISCR